MAGYSRLISAAVRASSRGRMASGAGSRAATAAAVQINVAAPPHQGATIASQLPAMPAGAPQQGYNFSPIAAGMMATGGIGLASTYAAAASSGAPIYPAQMLGPAGMLAGGAAGLVIGGIPGAATGAAIAAMGQIGQAFWQGGMNLYSAQNVAMAQSGFGAAASYQFADALSGLPGYQGKAIGQQAGYQALGQLSPFLGGGTSPLQLGGMAASMIRNFGNPDQAGFQAAASGIGPVGLDPFLNPMWRAAQNGQGVGPAGVYGAYNTLGPAAAFRAVAETRNKGDMALFNDVNRLTDLLTLGNRQAGEVAEAGAVGVRGALATGNRDKIGRAYGNALESSELAASSYGAMADLYEKEADAGDRSAVPLYAASRRLRLQSLADVRQYRTALQSRGADGEWTAANAQLRGDIGRAEMDPLMGFVSPSSRQALISSDSSRLAEIRQQLSGPNVSAAAKANLSAESQFLQTDIRQQQIDIRQGITGQMIALSAGAPTGFQAWGLQAMSLAAVQAHDPGIAGGFGGTGTSVGLHGGPDPTTLRMLERIARALEAGRGYGSGTVGSGAGSAYALVSNRANGKVGY